MKGIFSILVPTLLVLCALSANAQTKVLSVSDITSNGEQYIGKTITVRGLCSHLCSHGGRKMFIKDSNSIPLRIEAGKAIGAFDEKAVNSKVIVSGIVRESRIDEAYLLDWEASEKKSSAEHEGCETEAQAKGESKGSVKEKIASFRARIAKRLEKEGKPYLSIFYIEANSYKTL